MRGKRRIALALSAALALSLTACAGGAKKEETKEKETIMVYCWSEHVIYSGYAAYVQAQVPEADVVFVTGQNSMAYYEFMKEHGELPDILTVRRMSMIDAENLRDGLMDLSETEAAAGFNNIYLENYRFDDGTINWLPLCGEVDGYIVNLDLFEEYNIPIPTDRASFDAACEAFKAEGIQPYSNDFGKDYTCLETLQGLSIPELMTGEGIKWRTEYESGNARSLEETIWPGAFERLEKQLKVWGTPAEAAQYAYEEMVAPFQEGKAAMMRGTGNDVIALEKDGMNVSMLPYFGETEDDNWLLTYPSFNVAVSKKAAENPEKEELCMKVLEEMFSEGAQNILAGNHNMIPYNTGVTLELDDSMKNLEPYISTNRLYLRLASAEIFRYSLETVGKMVTGEYTAQQAYEEFNRLLQTSDQMEEETVVSLDRGYTNEFSREKGNEAASAMTNTLREYFGSDLLISHGTSYSGIVYETGYTPTQLNYMVTDTTIRNYTKELTGKEVKLLLDALLTKEYGGIAAINPYSLPVLSGCEMEVSEDEEGYHLEKVTVNGNEIKDEDRFTVTYVGSLFHAVPMLDDLWKEEGGAKAWTTTEGVTVQQHWKNCLLGTEEKEAVGLREASDYIEFVTK